MNAKMKRAERATRTQQNVTAPTAPVKAAALSPLRCLNPKCGRPIDSLHKYGPHGDGFTCCLACEDIFDPMSAEIRRQRSGRGTPSILGIDEHVRPDQVEADF
jgi:hypothetical protein